VADTQLTLNAEERDYLVQVLTTALKNHRIGEHRTRTPSYRQNILKEEDLLAPLLTKLGQAPE
jgi:hypothetical protein